MIKDLRVVAFSLFVLVVISSIMVGYATHKSRSLFAQLQLLERTQERLDLKWGQLQLEKSTWSMPAIVESKARKVLGMVPLESADVILLPLGRSKS